MNEPKASSSTADDEADKNDSASLEVGVIEITTLPSTTPSSSEEEFEIIQVHDDDKITPMAAAIATSCDVAPPSVTTTTTTDIVISLSDDDDDLSKLVNELDAATIEQTVIIDSLLASTELGTQTKDDASDVSKLVNELDAATIKQTELNDSLLDSTELDTQAKDDADNRSQTTTLTAEQTDEINPPVEGFDEKSTKNPVQIDPISLQVDIDDAYLEDLATKYADDPKIHDFNVKRTDSLERILEILPQIKNRHISSVASTATDPVTTTTTTTTTDSSNCTKRRRRHLDAAIFLIADLMQLNSSERNKRLLEIAAPLIDTASSEETQLRSNVAAIVATLGSNVNQSMALIVDLLSTSDALRDERLKELARQRLAALKDFKLLSVIPSINENLFELIQLTTDGKENGKKATAPPSTPLLETLNLQYGDDVDKVLDGINLVTAKKQFPAPRLNAESLLLLDLLACESDADREVYIVQMAQRRKLLITNDETDEIQLNPALLLLNGVMNTKMLEQHLKSEAAKKKQQPIVVLAAPQQTTTHHGGAIPKEQRLNECSSETIVEASQTPDMHGAIPKKQRLSESCSEIDVPTVVIKTSDIHGAIPKKQQLEPERTLQLHGTIATKQTKDVATVLDAKSRISTKTSTIEPSVVAGTFRNLSENEIIDQIEAQQSDVEVKSRRQKSRDANAAALSSKNRPTKRMVELNEKKSKKTNDEKINETHTMNLVEELHLKNQKIMCDLLAKMQIKPMKTEVKAEEPPPTQKRRKRRERQKNRSRDVSAATSTISTATTTTTTHSTIVQALDDLTDRIDSLDCDQNAHDNQLIISLIDNKIQKIKEKLLANQEKLRKNLTGSRNVPNKNRTKKDKPNFKDQLNQQHCALTNDCKSFLTQWTVNDKEFEFDLDSNLKSLEEYADKLVQLGHGTIVDAEIRVNQFNYFHAYCSRGAPKRDAHITNVVLRQCAMHGDFVRAFVYNDSYSQPPPSPLATNPNDNDDDDEPRAEPARAFVIRILERRHDRRVLGHCSVNANKDTVTMTTTNKRLPHLQIFKKTIPSEIAVDDQTLYLARIISWTADYKPIGELIRAFGDRNKLTTCNEAILYEHKLEVPAFSENILAELPSDSFKIPDKEYAARENLTTECVFTIDPATARDLDDAMSCKQLSNGNYEIGVHISDVTYFLKEFSELDMIVQAQATSIYLVDQVYHMLPRSLCMTCSLLPGEDKVTFSVFWEMDSNARIISTRFGRTIINSCAQLAYAHAQQMIDNPSYQFGTDELPPILNGFSVAHISHVVNKLHKLAVIMRKKRFDGMCIKMDQPKITFQLDPDTGEPISYERYRQLEANSLIEEFMLCANQSVADYIYAKYPQISILRNHAPPKASALEALATKLKQFNFKLDVSSSESISRSFHRIVNGTEHTEAVMCVLNEWLAKPMNRAEYFCSEIAENRSDYLWHFALAIPIYTHFTSPIRRYPDILVHRVLAAALSLAAVPQRSPEDLQKIATRCNVQKYNAKLAGEDSTGLYFLHYVQARETVKMCAVVTDMQSIDWIEVLLMETGHKFKVHLAGISSKHKLKLEITSNRPKVGLLRFVDVKDSKPVKLQVFATVMVEVSVKNEKLVANLVPKYGKV